MSEKVAVITAETGGIKTVSLEELEGKKVPEQFQLLEERGYQRGAVNYCCPTCIGEWNLILEASKEGHIAESDPNLLDVERLTVPFVLKDESGAVINEYNYVCLYYWDTDPARLIAEFWIKGGEQETVLTMPLTAKPTSNGFHISHEPIAYTLTAYDIKCYEERLAFHFSGEVGVAAVPNGRFVLATDVGKSGDCWSGFPVCGDGDEAQYKAAILRHIATGCNIGELYEVGQDDSMTFPTREAAQAWADRIGIELEAD